MDLAEPLIAAIDIFERTVRPPYILIDFMAIGGVVCRAGPRLMH